MKKTLFLLPVFIFYSCDLFDSKKGAVKTESHGRLNEVVLIGNEEKLSGPLGDSLRNLLQQKISWILQEEPLFRVYQVAPKNLNQFFRSFRNVLVVHSLNDSTPDGKILGSLFKPELIERNRKNPKDDFVVYQDLFSSGQHFYLYFGTTENDLLQNFNSRKETILKTIESNELAKIKKTLSDEKGNQELEKQVLKSSGAQLKLNGSFKIAADTSNFLWLRDLGSTYDRNIIIASEEYLSQEQFSPKEIGDWRDLITKEHIFGSGKRDTTSYMMREELEPGRSVRVTINQSYAMKTYGLWRLKNYARGGSYISLVALDEEQKRIYYLEAFLYAPGSLKRDVMREMEAILMTFKAPKRE